MNFSGCLRLLFLVGFVLAVGTSGCTRRLSSEEKRARNELRQALRAHQFARAIPLARRVLQSSPNEDGAWARVAEAQRGARDFAGLEKTLAGWPNATKTNSAKYHEYRGDLALAKRRPAEALAAWQQATNKESENTRVWAKIARVEQEEESWPEAVLAWTRAMKGTQESKYFLNRATCYRHLHNWDAVRADLQQAQKLAPQDVGIRQEVSRFDQLGNFLPAVRELDSQLHRFPNDPELVADRSLLFLRAGDPALAFEDASRAIRLAQSLMRPKIFRALAARALGRNQTTDLPTLTLEMLSPEFLQTVRRLDAEIMAEPKNTELLTERAWHLNEIDQPQFALADAENALHVDPKSAGACVEAGYALAKLRRKGEAYDQIEQATRLDPDLASAWQYRGELEMERNDYKAAIDFLTRALSINQTAAALTSREECYRKVGLIAKAEDDRKALEQFGPPQRKMP